MDEDFANSLLVTLTMYQQAFNTFSAENPTFGFDEIISMTDSWWNGVMYMAGLATQKGGNK